VVGTRRIPPRELEDHESVTQYGVISSSGPKDPFRDRPRKGTDSDGISLIVGRYSTEESSILIRGRPSFTPEDDRVRHTTIGTLRRAGFVPRHKPNRLNPNHIVVVHETQGVDWNGDAVLTFTMCFDMESGA
jgi:hypothetical protein